MQKSIHYIIKNVSFSNFYIFLIQNMQLILSHLMQTFITSYKKSGHSGPLY